MPNVISRQLRAHLIQAMSQLAHNHRIDEYAVAMLRTSNPKIWPQKAWAHIRRVNAKRLEVAKYGDPAYWRARRLGDMLW